MSDKLEKTECGDCNGDGDWKGKKCWHCNGRGFYLFVTLPEKDEEIRGITEGMIRQSLGIPHRQDVGEFGAVYTGDKK